MPGPHSVLLSSDFLFFEKDLLAILFVIRMLQRDDWLLIVAPSGR